MKLGIVGYGNMGKAILEGVLKSNAIEGKDIGIFDRNDWKRAEAVKLGAAAFDDIHDLLWVSDIVLLAIKPNQIEAMANKIKDDLIGKSVISIAAGVTMKRLEDYFGECVRLLRVMPNTPALVKEGAIVFCKEHTLNENELKFAIKLFQQVGKVYELGENYIDAVCGLSGAGPAYVSMFIEALGDGGVKEGLPRKIAYELAAQTVLGSAKLALDSGKHPGELKDMVTSPKGATIEGVLELEKHNFRYAVSEAVSKASEKSRNL